MREPYVLEFPKVGASDVGYISALDFALSLPFETKRVFWTYYTPESIVRGRHAHYTTEQVLIAVAGRILVTTESPTGVATVFVLDSPHQGVYIPPNVWHTMQYSHSAVQLVLASTQYDEQDYIRDYDQFRQIWKP